MICLGLVSCSTSIYYQMYKTKPITENIVINENALKFEDDNCVILYDFWGENGNIGFIIYNKSGEHLYLHLDKCFYVANGFAHDYYQNRIYNTSTIVTSIATVEKAIICIPPQCFKKINEFNINDELYKDCDITLYPNKNEKNTLNFTPEDSPFVFGNRLAYSIGTSETITQITNDFYVSQISNYPIDKITESVTMELCGKKLYGHQERVFINSGPDIFYIQYNYDYRYDNKSNNPYYQPYY